MSRKLMFRSEVAKARVEPIAVISIQDMQLPGPVQVGADGWGWDRNIHAMPAQPALISMSVSLQQPFKESSEIDDIADDTIHYGRLRSGIVEAVNGYNILTSSRGIVVEFSPDMLLENLYQYFFRQAQLTTEEKINWASFKIMLPTASLLGAGISITNEMVYMKNKAGVQAAGDNNPGRSSTLRVHDLRIPTLVGILPKERLRKQIVVANVEIDRFIWAGDLHTDVEQILVKTIEESSFQTLEALAEHLGKHVTRYFVIPCVCLAFRGSSSRADNKWMSLSEDYTKVPWKKLPIIDQCPTIKIKLEKPNIYNDCMPSVEMTIDTRPLPNSPYYALWKGFKNLKIMERQLQGTIKDWIAENVPEDLGEGESSLLDIQRKIESFQASLALSKSITKDLKISPSTD